MTGKLHLFCGKIAAGKSTLAREIAHASGALLISEDHWLNTLYGDQMTNIQDYLRCSALLRQAMEPHVSALLTTGVSVALDFPANTIQTREWMRRVIATSSADHTLHWLDLPDAVCLQRMQARQASGDHPFNVTEAQFQRVTRAFEPPSPAEGFAIHRHTASETE